MMSSEEGKMVIREAVKEALNAFSTEVDLKLEKSELAILSSIRDTVDESLQRYIGMSAIEHGIAHDKASEAVNVVNEIRQEVRTWFIRAILAGVIVTSSALYQSNKVSYHVPYLKPIEEYLSEPLKEFHPE